MSTAETAATVLSEMTQALAARRLRIIDLSQTLTPGFPQIVLPPEFDQCAPFRMEAISHYDERGPNVYWNNISFGEHSGTHFDAPIHWITGRDLPHASTDTLPERSFIAPACVVDCSADAARDADFLLTVRATAGMGGTLRPDSARRLVAHADRLVEAERSCCLSKFQRGRTTFARA